MKDDMLRVRANPVLRRWWRRTLGYHQRVARETGADGSAAAMLLRALANLSQGLRRQLRGLGIDPKSVRPNEPAGRPTDAAPFTGPPVVPPAVRVHDP